jgi:hypothetical protein
MRHALQCFQEHRGIRGVTFYDEDRCNFLAWDEVLRFLQGFPPNAAGDEFYEQLSEALANYDPDTQYLAVRQYGSKISVELFSSVTRG